MSICVCVCVSVLHPLMFIVFCVVWFQVLKDKLQYFGKRDDRLSKDPEAYIRMSQVSTCAGSSSLSLSLCSGCL